MNISRHISKVYDRMLKCDVGKERGSGHLGFSAFRTRFVEFQCFTRGPQWLPVAVVVRGQWKGLQNSVTERVLVAPHGRRWLHASQRC